MVFGADVDYRQFHVFQLELVFCNVMVLATQPIIGQNQSEGKTTYEV